MLEAKQFFSETGAMHYDSTGQMIDDMLETLSVSKTRLAAMLGVSERTLTDWRSKGVGDLRTKALRLARLCEVVAELRKLAPETKPLNILEDGRVPVSADDELDSITLLAYVNAYPEERGWAC